MYVNLYPAKQLKRTKRFITLVGLFLVTGGAYALYREVFLLAFFRPGWAVSSGAVLVAGFAFLYLSRVLPGAKEAYFSMDQERIMYRLALFSREKIIFWATVRALEISAHAIVYRLVSGESIKMCLGNIQQAEVMLHVCRSIHLAALEKGITVNGIQPESQAVAAQA